MKKFFAAKLAAVALFVASVSTAVAGVEADEALKMLIDGNKGFAKYGDVSTLTANSKPARRQYLGANGQKPFAIVVTCSDSRVPPEILFDRGLGEIFVVRVAGNVVAPHELGSIEYGIEHLGANLVVVLGHSKCGAVNSTITALKTDAPMEGNIGNILEDIKFNLGGDTAKAYVNTHTSEECIVENLSKVAESLTEKSPIIEEYVNGVTESTGEKRFVKIYKAKYDIDNGLVSVLY